MGIMLDKVMLEAFHLYLGQASSVMRPYFNGDHFILRRGYEQVVDEYRDSVAALNLRDGHYHRAHDNLKLMSNAIFCQARFSSSVEPLNIFHGKVTGDLYE